MKKRTSSALAVRAAVGLAAAALLALGAFLWARAGAHVAKTPPADEVVASIQSTLPVHTTVPTTVSAWGDVAPAQSQSLSLPRAGQLIALPVVVGQRVRVGAPLARVASDPSSDTGYLNAQNALKLAAGERQRVEALFGLQLATASQVETAKKTELDARNALDAQRKTGVGIGDATVTAPFDGVVTALTAALGDRLAANAPILQIGRVDRLRVNLGIEPTRRDSVHVGDAVSLAALPPRPDDDGKAAAAAEGRIASVQDLVDPKTQLVSAVVEVAAASAGSLVLGMRVQAGIVTGHVEGWLLPRLAVLKDDQGEYVYRVRAGLAQRVGVQSRTEVRGQVVVDGPLDAATPVVALGNYELQDGMKVREAAR
jgi:RND family efflux transporter MFP subunit